MMRSLIPEHIKPLIKTRKGKLVVVGCVSNKKGIKLVVRCDCGKYETRRPSSWKRPNHSNYCQLCEQMENLRLRHLPMEEVRQIHERQRQTLEVPRKTG